MRTATSTSQRSSAARTITRQPPHSRGVPVLWRTCLTLVVSAASLAAAVAGTLNDIKYTSLPGDRVQIKMQLSQPLGAEPLNFTIDNPARIALDFPGTTAALPVKSQTIGVGKVESVTAVEAEGRTRVVVNLVQLVPYKIESSGSEVTLTLEGVPADITNKVAAAPAPAAATAKPASTGVTMPGTASGARIKGIDFRRGAHGEAQVVVDLSDPKIGIDIKEQGGKLLVDFINASLPDELDRKLDVTDFATPAKEIDTKRFGNGTRMVVTATGNFEHLAYQSDNIFTLELRPRTKAEVEQAKKDKFGYTGDRLSLNFQDIEVRAVLQLIADFTGKNLVTSDTVSGHVTLRLKNVPWDQAMDLILKTKGLGQRQSGNVIMVAPQEEIAAREKLELESQKQIEELAPLKTEFVQVNYAKASDLATLLKAETNKLMTARGNVTVDERTNTLLVQDTAEALTDVRKVVQALDIPVRQVLIESRIVVANEDFSKDLGVRFGYSHINNPKNEALTQAGGLQSNFVSLIGGGINGNTKYSGVTSFNTDGKENYIVDLPVAGPAAAFKWSIGKIGSYLLQLELSALQVEGRGEILASPQVITANQKEAVIESGTEIPYQQASSSGATSVSFKKAVLSLTVTPHITPDDRIIMDLKVNRDSVGKIFAGVPSIDTNEVQTQVLVENGETVVLGGIMTSTNRNDKTSVPFFGELPYLGHLFKRTSVTNKKQELLIFVTPKILKESLSITSR
ncbi:MAG: type IV pilus secretin PilQ [Gammaproteobacteria bacterium]|nr:type IV pilus secretin PilQ [Gammaproteobacteria bacterium]